MASPASLALRFTRTLVPLMTLAACSDATGDPACSSPRPSCVLTCGSAAVTYPSCQHGAWICPEGTVDFSACPKGTCMVSPFLCTDCSTGKDVSGWCEDDGVTPQCPVGSVTPPSVCASSDSGVAQDASGADAD